METMRLVHRESRIMSPLIPSILGLAVLVLAACSTAAPSATQQIPNTQPPSEEATPPLSGALVNACTYRVPEPTPTPDLTTPTATPFSNTTPIPYPTESPSAEVVAYPDLPPPALPASVEAWRDAVVRVSVERASGRPRDQQGLGRVHTKRSASKMSANEMNPRKITSSFSKREKMRRNPFNRRNSLSISLRLLYISRSYSHG